MPARKGFPFKELYREVKDMIGKGKYAFVRKGHTYLGYRKEIALFGQKEYAYVYVDKFNALKRVSDYLSDHEREFAALKVKDKDWTMVGLGYFVLLSNINTTPADLLEQYVGRTDIEVVFKTGKEVSGPAATVKIMSFGQIIVLLKRPHMFNSRSYIWTKRPNRTGSRLV